jgi:hypothetical protein
VRERKLCVCVCLRVPFIGSVTVQTKFSARFLLPIFMLIFRALWIPDFVSTLSAYFILYCVFIFLPPSNLNAKISRN